MFKKVFLVLFFFFFSNVYAGSSFKHSYGAITTSGNYFVLDSLNNDFYIASGDVGINGAPEATLDVYGTVSANALLTAGQLRGQTATFNGVVTANAFSGDGSGLTNMGGSSPKYYLVSEMKDDNFGSGSTTLTQTLKANSGITLSGNNIVLPANRKYMGYASIQPFSADAGDWANVTFTKASGSATLYASTGRIAGPLYTGAQGISDPSFFIATTDETEIYCNRTAGSGTFDIQAFYTYLYIWEI